MSDTAMKGARFEGVRQLLRGSCNAVVQDGALHQHGVFRADTHACSLRTLRVVLYVQCNATVDKLKRTRGWLLHDGQQGDERLAAVAQLELL
jgi:hypothetical protein